MSGTATPGADYTALTGTVVIASGSLATSSNAMPGAQTSATAFIGDAQSDNAPFIQIVSP